MSGVPRTSPKHVNLIHPTKTHTCISTITAILTQVHAARRTPLSILDLSQTPVHPTPSIPNTSLPNPEIDTHTHANAITTVNPDRDKNIDLHSQIHMTCKPRCAMTSKSGKSGDRSFCGGKVQSGRAPAVYPIKHLPAYRVLQYYCI